MLPTFPTSIPEAARVDVTAWDMQYLAGGEVRTFGGDSAQVRSPICLDRGGTLERVDLGRIASLDAETARGVLASATKAWDHGRGVWPTTRVARRIGCLERFTDELVQVREPVVRLLMLEIGKTRKDAEAEFDRTVTYVRDTVEAVKDLDRTSSRFVMEDGFLGQIRRSPLGVVLCMGPFNYPLNETYTTLIPALVMGNAVISKLPKYGALLHLPILAAMQRSFPPGVVNVLQGDGPKVVGPMMESGQIDSLAFIGTSRVANILKRQHPRPNRLRSILGLEAKNPAVVLPSADLSVAVKECVSGALSFNGQRCTALKLIFVHRSLAERFVADLSKAVDELRAGMPWEPSVTLTPLPEDGKTDTLAAFVEDAVGKGARVTNRGGQAHGTFFRPAVVYPVTPAMRLFHEEQFGPIVPVAVYDDLSEIDAFMRESPYGQQISLFGNDPKEVAALVDALVNVVSRINLNTQCRRGPDTFPFTGRKDSAEGTLSVSDALRAFSIRAVVAASSTEANKELVSSIVTGRMSSFLGTDFIF